MASTEVADPRPFLRGGEVLLTTGLAFGDDPAGYVERLAGAGLAGLGFAVGVHLADAPGGARRGGRARSASRCSSCPYETPFVAITEAAMTRIVNEQYAQLARAVELHDRLVDLVLEEAGLDAIAAAAADAIGGRVRMLARDGREVAAAGAAPAGADTVVLDIGVHAPGEAVLEATVGRDVHRLGPRAAAAGAHRRRAGAGEAPRGGRDRAADRRRPGRGRRLRHRRRAAAGAPPGRVRADRG